METNKILSAGLLDLLFEGRNKEYGAYALRRDYDKRMRVAIFITAGLATALIAATFLTRSSGNDIATVNNGSGVIISEVVLPPIIPPVQPEKKLIRIETVPFTSHPEIVKDVVKPMAAQQDIATAQIGVLNVKGVPATGIVTTTSDGDGKGTIVPARTEPQVEFKEVEAAFPGDWKKFLENTLHANVPADNGAPNGNYTVQIQFVVDIDGNVSDIKALTNFGYGMEEEAIRAIKKAKKWTPAMQNGIQVKAYRRQAITFQVMGE